MEKAPSKKSFPWAVPSTYYWQALFQTLDLHDHSFHSNHKVNRIIALL